jgi:hypothetical protein
MAGGSGQRNIPEWHCRIQHGAQGGAIGIQKYFVGKGESVNGGLDDAPMLVRRNTRHGPLYAGCDCVAIAG